MKENIIIQAMQNCGAEVGRIVNVIMADCQSLADQVQESHKQIVAQICILLCQLGYIQPGVWICRKLIQT